MSKVQRKNHMIYNFCSFDKKCQLAGAFACFQVGQAMGVAQSTVNAYELGQRRVPVSALPLLARTLGVDLETLMGQDEAKAGRRGPAPKLAQHMERIRQLPKPKQRFVMEMLDTVLAQAGR